MSLRFAAAALALATICIAACKAGPDDPSEAFRLTRPQLEAAIGGLRTDVNAAILARPAEFLALLRDTLTAPQDLLVLVDKSRGLAAGAVPADLVPLAGHSLTLNRAGLTLRALVLPDLVAMADSARSSGVALPISSTYRSYEYQEQLFERSLATMSREAVERELAYPGHSEHQLGTAIDFGSVDASFEETAAGRWLADNAWRFGFVLSYPRGREEETGYIHEPWHYRYLGEAASALVHGFFAGSAHAFLLFYQESQGRFRERLAPRESAPALPRP